MARLFDGSDDSVFRDSAVFTAAPFTMACWFNVVDITSTHHLFFVGQSGSDNQRWALKASGAIANDPVQFFVKTASTTQISTTTGYSANTWHHACAVEGSGTDHRVYIDGGSKASSVDSRIPTAASIDRTAVGYRHNTSPLEPCNGRIADAVIWNVALTDAEVAIISRPGFQMHRYRPESIKLYWRLGVATTEPDWSGNGFHGTLLSAPTIADHVGGAPPFGYDIWSPRSAAAISATPSAGVLSMAGIAPYLGFTINMPDEA
jgi:hypothetical protein